MDIQYLFQILKNKALPFFRRLFNRLLMALAFFYLLGNEFF